MKIKINLLQKYIGEYDEIDDVKDEYPKINTISFLLFLRFLKFKGDLLSLYNQNLKEIIWTQKLYTTSIKIKFNDKIYEPTKESPPIILKYKKEVFQILHLKDKESI